MTDSATARYGARQQSQGSNTNTWGDDKLNEALRLFDRGSKGVQTLTLTGDTVLSWSNYAATNDGQCAILILAGSLSSAVRLTVPAVQWQWDLVKNATGQAVTVKTSGGAGVVIPNGRQLAVFCDGADCYFGAANYLGGDISEINPRDLMDKSAIETAIATAGLPATAGTVLNSVGDTTAGYLFQKVTGSGAVAISTTNAGGNEKTNISVADSGFIDGGLQSASFLAVVGNAYAFPVGGTITLPTPTGSRRKILLSPFGAGVTVLSGIVNGVNSVTAYILDGDQTETLTDSDATRGWV